MSITNIEADHRTREFVKELLLTEVSHIRLVGSGTSHIPQEGVEIHDPVLIREFISGIQNAVKPVGTEISWPGIRPDMIEIYTKQRTKPQSTIGAKLDYDIGVAFFADVPPYTIGPDFQRALRHAGIRYGQKEFDTPPFSILGIGTDDDER